MLSKLVQLTEKLQNVIHSDQNKLKEAALRQYTHELNMYGFLQKRILGENENVPKVDDSKEQQQTLIFEQRRFGK